MIYAGRILYLIFDHFGQKSGKNATYHSKLFSIVYVAIYTHDMLCSTLPIIITCIIITYSYCNITNISYIYIYLHYQYYIITMLMYTVRKSYTEKTLTLDIQFWRREGSNAIVPTHAAAIIYI